ncbi:MAG: methyltransferase family protein [Sumerlaeia bacterium]
MAATNHPSGQNSTSPFLSGISYFWPLKLVLSLAIIGLTCFTLFQAEIPTARWLLAVCVILAGAAIELSHYRVLKKSVGPLGKPEKLNTTGLLFPVIRHPMYFGDLLMLLGFSLLAFTPLLFGIYAAFAVICLLLCLSEDRMMQAAFPEEFNPWKARTALVIPFIF